MHVNLKSPNSKKGDHIFKKKKQDPGDLLAFLLTASEADISAKVQNTNSKDLSRDMLAVLKVLILKGDGR